MLENYFPVLLFLAIGCAVGIGAIVVSGVLGRLTGAYPGYRPRLTRTDLRGR